MPTDLTRMTFTVTKDMEILLKKFKKEMFYDCNQSEMIRELVLAGIRAKEQEKVREFEQVHGNDTKSGE